MNIICRLIDLRRPDKWTRMSFNRALELDIAAIASMQQAHPTQQ